MDAVYDAVYDAVHEEYVIKSLLIFLLIINVLQT